MMETKTNVFINKPIHKLIYGNPKHLLDHCVMSLTNTSTVVLFYSRIQQNNEYDRPTIYVFVV